MFPYDEAERKIWKQNLEVAFKKFNSHFLWSRNSNSRWNPTYRNSYTCALHLGAVLCSKITNTKYKNEKNMALDRRWKGYLFTVWELKTEGSLVRRQRESVHWVTQIILCSAYSWMTMTEPWVLIWGDQQYVHMLQNMSNSARGIFDKIYHCLSPSQSISFPHHPMATWFPSTEATDVTCVLHLLLEVFSTYTITNTLLHKVFIVLWILLFSLNNTSWKCFQYQYV